MNYRRVFLIFCFCAPWLSGCQLDQFTPLTEDKATSPAPGVLSHLQSNSWTIIDTETSVTNTPLSAFSYTYTFNARGGFDFTMQDLITGGLTVTAAGVYALSEGDVVLAFRSANEWGTSLIGTGLLFVDPLVTNATFSYRTTTGAPLHLYLKPAPVVQPLPVGVWRFNGAMAIDFVVVAPTRYVVIQTRDDHNNPVLVEGVFTPTNTGGASIALYAGTPNNVQTVLDFDAYGFDATTLTLRVGQSTSVGTKW